MSIETDIAIAKHEAMVFKALDDKDAVIAELTEHLDLIVRGWDADKTIGHEPGVLARDIEKARALIAKHRSKP